MTAATNDTSLASPVGLSLEDVVCELQPLDEERKTQRMQALKKLTLLLKVWARMVVYQLGHPDKVVSQKHLK